MIDYIRMLALEEKNETPQDILDITAKLEGKTVTIPANLYMAFVAMAAHNMPYGAEITEQCRQLLGESLGLSPEELDMHI